MASESGVSEMMTIEKFGVFRNGSLIYSSMRNSLDKANRQAERFALLHRVAGFFTEFEVRPVCWSAERGEFIAVPDSISI